MRLVVAALIAAVIVAATVPAFGASSAHFKSPSGNINCRVFAYGGGSAECLLLHDSWSHHRPRPASCQLDWDPTQIDLQYTHVHVGSCRGDIGPLCEPTGGDSCTVLHYGSSVTVGKIRCKSTSAGVTCRRTTGRHQGFFISRQRYKIYR
jgi:hypothetical protein